MIEKIYNILIRILGVLVCWFVIIITLSILSYLRNNNIIHSSLLMPFWLYQFLSGVTAALVSFVVGDYFKKHFKIED